jgi:uncharacterized delta-60 repeat protein
MPQYQKISKYFVATILMLFIVAGFISILPSLGIVNQPSASSSAVFSNGALDTNFENKYIKGANGDVTTSAIQTDGKIIIGGSFTSYGGIDEFRVARLNTDGTPDTTFAQTGTGINGAVKSLVIQSDGKILVGGAFTSYNGISAPRLLRLNSDGTLDSSFSQTGTGLNNTVNTILVLPDSMILVGGSFTTYNGVSQNYIARLSSTGALDTTFVIGTGFQFQVYALARQSDGKFIVGGAFEMYKGSAAKYIIRLNSDGSKDASFVQSGLTAAVTSIAIQSDGKVIAGGTYTSYSFVITPYVVRLGTDGVLDSSFSWTSLDITIRQLFLQEDGKILVGGGYNSSSNAYLSRINSDGTVDNTFVLTGTGFGSSNIYSMALQEDGKIIVGGYFSSYNGVSTLNIARLNTNGSLDGAFSYGNGLTPNVSTIARQPDGKILAGGTFTVFAQSTVGRIVRLNSDGSFDTAFSQGNSGFNGSVYDIVAQPDGKILVGGEFTTYNGISSPRIARLNSDGTLDTSFNVGTGFGGTVNVMALYPNGKILASGNFTSYKGTSIRKIARLNSDGTLDMTFTQAGTGINNYANTVVILPDGKILAGGYFASFNGTTTPNLLRLNEDGSLDTTFVQTGAGIGSSVISLAIQPNGKILVGGSFSTYDGNSRSKLLRLNADGSLDTTFTQTGTGLNSNVNSIAVQSDGKILIGGHFSTYNGTSLSRLARLNEDGTIDSTFVQSGAGFNNAVRDFILQSSGKIIVAGDFTSYNSRPLAYLTRLGYDFSDVVPPSGDISINSGASSTTSDTVTLNLTASDAGSGVIDMIVCNSPSFTDCVWEGYSTSKTWNLENTLGLKTVYVKYRDGEELSSPTYYANITIVAPAEEVVPDPVVNEPVVVTPPAQTTGTTHTYTPAVQEPVVTPQDNIVEEEPVVLPVEIKILNENGTPIIGARVEIDGETYITSSSGTIKITNFNAVKKYIAKVAYNGKVYSEEILGVEEDNKTVVINTKEDVKNENTNEEVQNKNIPWYYYVGFSVLLSVIVVIVLGRKKKNGVNKPEGYTTGDIQ